MWRKAKSYYVSVVIIILRCYYYYYCSVEEPIHKQNADRKQEYPFLGVLSIFYIIACTCEFIYTEILNMAATF